MPQSKNRVNHKQKLQQFKNQTKKRTIMNQQIPQMPPVRNIPVWDPNATIEVKGFEWEAIQNGLTNIQMALQASQSVMSRNILNGTIGMEFEKLNAETLTYEPMNEEESANSQREFKEQVEAFKVAQAAQVAANDASAAQAPQTDEVAVKPTKSKKGKIVDMIGKALKG